MTPKKIYVKRLIMKIILLVLTSLVLFISCENPDDAKKHPHKIIQKIINPDWRKPFPKHWWKEVPKEEAKSWEILPQEAAENEVILSKRNELGGFSNFAEISFVYHGVCYPTVEAFWQMLKYPEAQVDGAEDPRWTWTPQWLFTRTQVATMNGYQAKKAGNYANGLLNEHDANWVSFEGQSMVFSEKTPGAHYNLIWSVLSEKLKQNEDLRNLLLSTKNLKLRPDHNVGDAPTEWHFNLLYMKMRDMLQNGSFNLQTKEDLTLKNCKSIEIK